MQSHLLLLIVFAALVSAVFAVLQRERPRDQVRLGLLLFAAFVGTALVAGWLMFPFPLGAR
jgi:prepilin signal peptidase PulO-like enzyme (type II secretory pathway)